MAEYTTRKRDIPSVFSGKARGQLERLPWGLYRDGLPVGWYATREEAVAAMPLAEVREERGLL